MYIYKYILLLMYVDENLFGYWRLLEYSLCYPNALGNYYYHHYAIMTILHNCPFRLLSYLGNVRSRFHLDPRRLYPCI